MSQAKFIREFLCKNFTEGDLIDFDYICNILKEKNSINRVSIHSVFNNYIKIGKLHKIDQDGKSKVFKVIKPLEIWDKERTLERISYLIKCHYYT